MDNKEIDNKEIFAERLRQLREKMKKTQKEFAEEVGSTPATISAYENATKNPSLDIVLNIAKNIIYLSTGFVVWKI